MIVMKKLCLIVAYFAICFPALAQKTLDLTTMRMSNGMAKTTPTRDVEYNSDGVTVTYHLNNIQIHDDPIFSGASIVSIDGFWPNHNPGEPAILMKWDTFVIPNGNATVSLIDSTVVELTMELTPGRHILSDSNYETHSKDNVKPIAAYSGYYPSALILTTRKNAYRNNPLLEVCISPIQYDYRNKRVKIYKDFKFKINFDMRLYDAQKESLDYPSNTFLNNIALNASSKTQVNSKGTSSIATLLPKSHYLIITVPQYAEAANRFAEWKRTLGFDVQIATQSTWTTTQVKNTILNAYNTNHIEYILIIGGHSDVPAQNSGIFNIHITDLYYGCIGNTYTPSIYRGRIPVSTSAEANTVIEKIINYEKNPCTTPTMYNSGINCAYFQDSTHDGYEDRRFTLTSERIRDRVLQLGKTVKRIYYAEPNVEPTNWDSVSFANGEPIPTSLTSQYFSWNGSSDDISNNINSKSFYVFYRDHANVNGWSHPQFTITDVNALNNGNALPVVFSICCRTGKFNNPNCFCEVFLKKNYGGCSAIFGATETSYSGFNDVLAEGMFDAIWPSSSLWPSIPNTNGINTSAPTPTYRLGQILDQGLRRVDEAYLGTADVLYSRYTHELYHCFGDPSMMIYTETPTPFSNASIHRENGIIYVDTGGEVATITYYNKQTGFIVSFEGTSHTFSDNPKITVCISAHNKIPFIDGGVIYIQNQTLASDSNFENDTIKVGNHVTSTIPQGDVNFTQGHHILKGNVIELHPGTNISVGATVDIKNY